MGWIVDNIIVNNFGLKLHLIGHQYNQKIDYCQLLRCMERIVHA